MGKCSHENLTIDRYCNDCGRDLIVDDREDAIRQHEQERIIKLLKHEYLEMEGLEYEHFSDTCITCDNIALIERDF